MTIDKDKFKHISEKDLIMIVGNYKNGEESEILSKSSYVKEISKIKDLFFEVID